MAMFWDIIYRAYKGLFWLMADPSPAQPVVPTTLPVPNPWAVQCCGCNGLMGIYGGVVHHDKSWVDWSRVASFRSHADADREAKRNDWEVTADLGHRCRECVSKAKRTGTQSTARGAIVRHGGYQW
jgi:hypothetical protein